MGTRTWVGLAIIMILWATNFAVAADWSMVPSINLKTEYNSNINNTSGGSGGFNGSNGSTGKLSDFIFTLNPSAAFNYTTEASNLQGNVGISQLLYVKNTGYDHTDQNYRINGQYSLTPRFNVFLNTSFISDSTAQEEILASGLAITRTPRLSFVAGPGMRYNLTERLSVTLGYNFNKVVYQSSQNTQTQSYQPFSTQAVNMVYQYLLTERTTLSNTTSATETKYTGSTISDYKSLLFSLGVTHQHSEKWEFNLAGGLNYSYYSSNSQIASFGQFPNFVSVPTQTQTGTNFSPYFNLGATRRWTNLSITGSLSRNQQASGYGYISQVNALSLAMNYSFTERLNGSLGGSYSLSSQSSNTSQNQNNYYSVGPQLNYLITEKLTATSAYRFSNQSYGGNNISGNTNSNVHDISLMFTYAYPMHYQK